MGATRCIISLSELGLYKRRKRYHVEDEVDDEKSEGKDEADAKVEPAVEKEGKLVALEAVLLLEIVRTVDVPGNRYRK